MTKTLNKSLIAKLACIQILGSLVGLMIGLKWGITNDLSEYQNKLYKNIVVAGVNVGALPPSKALESVEEEYIDQILKRTITLTLNEKTFVVTAENLFAYSNAKEVIHNAYNYPMQLDPINRWVLLFDETPRKFDVAIHFDDKAINRLADSIIQTTQQKISDADISINKNHEIMITPHTEAYTIDRQELVKAIKTALYSSFDEPINILDFAVKHVPTRTTSLLEQVDTCVVSFSTHFTPNTSRATNIKLSAKAIDGTLLAPGDIFSFNDAVGETTAEKGYKYAAVIANSRLSQGLGGGICQVSSTLYNAILRMGLYPLNRKPHSIPVGYVPLGLDATVSWESIDFKFKNTLEYPIYIQAYTESDKIYVNIYSNHALTNKSYELKTEVYAKIPSSKQSAYYSALAAKSSGRGYQIKVSREVYEKNVLKETELISLDSY